MPILAFPNHPSLTYLVRFLLLGLLYAATAYVSLAYVPATSSGIPLVWPAAAVGLAGLFFWGLNLWTALACSLFFALVLHGESPALAAGLTVANTLEALIGAYTLAQLGFHPLLNRLHDSLAFVLTAFFASFLSATLIVGSAALFTGGMLDATTWLGFWIGHAVSILSFGPFFVRWGYRPMFSKTWREILVGTLVFGSTAALTLFAFWTEYDSLSGIPLLYLLVFPLTAAALRTGPRGISLSIFLITAISVSGIVWGSGSVTERIPATLFDAQILIGSISIIFLLFTSTTEERKEAVIALESHLLKLEDEYEKVYSEDKAKSEFIAVLAHELRNPLAAVLSGLEVLKLREKGSPEVHQMMDAHLAILVRLLDDLLDTTRISKNRFVLERETVRLQDVLERSLEMALPYLIERKHVFVRTVSGEDMWVYADPVRLEQIFVNLINNAAKYTPEGGRIQVSAELSHGEVVVRVRDNGPGIAPERMREIFEPFAGTAQRNGSSGGLHIGLSLAKRMVELHGGRIEVVSALGAGSEFIVYLPGANVSKTDTATKKTNAREQLSAETAPVSPAGARSLRVLVVDDNEAAASLLSTLLTHGNHQVAVAHTGHEALAAAERSRPDAVLLDIGLPDIDGYEVARRLRAQFGSEILLIAITGYGQSEDRERAKGAGFDEHLVKPVSIVDVERVLTRLKNSAYSFT